MPIRISRLVFIGTLLSAVPIFAWDSVAPRATSEKETAFYGATLRAQMRYKSWLPLFESNYRTESGNQGNPRIEGVYNTTTGGLNLVTQQTWHAMLGSYFNIFDSLMVGGFYRYAQGERHRNDWVGSGWAAAGSSTWDWFWLNTNNRSEQSAIGDVTWRQALKFLPGENWVFELKNRFHYTWYSDDRYSNRDNWGAHSANVAETKYVLRPGLQYFWLSGDKPFMTFFLQYEAHFALNFGTRNLVEQWGYFGFFYHVSEEVALGFNVARAQWWWSESDSVKNIRAAEMCASAAGGAATNVCNTTQSLTTQRAWVIGFTAMLRFDFTPID